MAGLPAMERARQLREQLYAVRPKCGVARDWRSRNAIERMFCRLKDFRRIATRYDRLAINFLAAVCIAAVVSYWL